MLAVRATKKKMSNTKNVLVTEVNRTSSRAALPPISTCTK